jgi:hypothetical protein
MKITSRSKIRRYTALVGIFLIMATLITGIPVSYGVGGDTRTLSDNLEIRTWYDLDAVRDNLNGSHTLMNDLDSTTPGYGELASPTANDGKGWEPMGFYRDITPEIPSIGCGQPVLADEPDLWDDFRGTFNGHGYEIRDLFINRPVEDRVGLFGSVDDDGIIKNIGVVNVTVTGSMQVGGLVGYSSGTVSNSYSTGNVTGNCYVGGLMGQKSYGSIISNSYYNYDEVLINGENIITIGALFDEDFDQWLANDKFLDVNERLSQESGYYVVNNFTDFKELLAFGQDSSLKFRLKNDLDLATEPNFYIPYFAGELDGNGHKISNLSFDFDFVSPVGLFGCLASAGKITDLGVENVNVTGIILVGGLVGLNWNGTVSNSYATGSVSGDEDVGGLVGFSWGYVSNSYSSGNMTGDNHVGGLVGKNWGNVSSSYSTGSVTGTQIVGGLVGYSSGTLSNSYSTSSVYGSDYVGGLVGWKARLGTVSNAYSTGSVSGNERVGGLIGFEQGGSVSNSFWDTETSGQATSDGGMGRTTAQMKSITTFTFTGSDWNIIAVALNETNPAYIWNIVDAETYPFLSWQS